MVAVVAPFLASAAHCSTGCNGRRRCMSPSCYEWQYGGDALEEGEVNRRRGHHFKMCTLRELRDVKAAAAGLPPRQQLRTPGYQRL